MYKKITTLGFVFTMSLFFGISQTQAATLDYVTTGAVGYFPNETNRVVMQFDITATVAEKVSAISIQNNSIAPANYVTGYSLWKDTDGSGSFNEFLDTNLGVPNQNTNVSSIYWQDLNLSLANKTRFFITINTGSNSNITSNSTLTYRLFKEDSNNNNIFDFNNDFGVFFTGANTLPATNTIYTSDSVSVLESPIDQSKPVGAITSVINGQKIFGKSFVLTGKAKDIGGGNVAKVDLIIDGSVKTVETANGWQDFTYNWTASVGTHNLVLSITDTNNNLNASAFNINVSVDQSIFSAEKSILSVSKLSAKADNTDSITLQAFIKDTDGSPIVDRPITLAWDGGVKPDSVVMDSVSNEIGSVTIVLKSLKPVTATARVSYEGTEFASRTIAFANDLSVVTPVPGVNVASGDLIKTNTNSAVYYLGANGRRYVFPTSAVYFSWYKDFTTVKTITVAEMNKIDFGGVVTFKPGTTLLKATTVPKIYAIGAHGDVRWITSADVAVKLYGANWESKIQEIEISSFSTYTIGATIDNETEYNVLNELANARSINVDKGLGN